MDNRFSLGETCNSPPIGDEEVEGHIRSCDKGCDFTECGDLKASSGFILTAKAEHERISDPDYIKINPLGRNSRHLKRSRYNFGKRKSQLTRNSTSADCDLIRSKNAFILSVVHDVSNMCSLLVADHLMFIT